MVEHSKRMQIIKELIDDNEPERLWILSVVTGWKKVEEHRMFQKIKWHEKISVSEEWVWEQ